MGRHARCQFVSCNRYKMCALALSLRFIVDFGAINTTVQPNIPCAASPIAQSRSRSRGFSFSFSGDRPRERERDRERERERERFRSRDLSSLRSSGPPAPAAAFSRSAFIWAIWSLRSAELGLGARRQFGSRPRSPRSRDRERSRPPLLPHCFFWASNRWRMSLRKQPIQ
jgi:hypothetical protein